MPSRREASQAWQRNWLTATQRSITPQNEREAGEHDGPSADEENIFQTRGPAEVLTEFGERREGESAESYSNHRPLERSAAADVTVHQSIKVLAAYAGTHGIHDASRGRLPLVEICRLRANDDLDFLAVADLGAADGQETSC